MPDGKTIAHGYLTLSLVSQFVGQVRKVEGIKRSLNYGSNRVRFISPVQAGARIRGRVRLKALDDQPPNGVRATYETTIEIEGGAKPACVAETLGVPREVKSQRGGRRGFAEDAEDLRRATRAVPSSASSAHPLRPLR